jgi:hypothetical protein
VLCLYGKLETVGPSGVPVVSQRFILNLVLNMNGGVKKGAGISRFCFWNLNARGHAGKK